MTIHNHEVLERTVMSLTARGRSGIIWPSAAGTFARIADGHLGPTATFRPVVPRQVVVCIRLPIDSITLSDGKAQV
jgi:hypothetical protein